MVSPDLVAPPGRGPALLWAVVVVSGAVALVVLAVPVLAPGSVDASFLSGVVRGASGPHPTGA